MRLRVALAALLLPVLLAACSSESSSPERGSGTTQVSWDQVRLPTPPGPAGRLAVRDALRCGERWYVAGGVYVTEEDSRPALWSSTDLEDWQVERLAPEGYWAQRAVISSLGCRDGIVAMVGSKDGGAHGNPRVSTWYQRPDGVYVDVDAAFELYGGPQAVGVGSIAGAPPGWLIVGNRTKGAAVWTSPDAREFTLLDDDPQLAKDSDFDTTALDQVWDGRAWTVVGSATTPGRIPRVPLAWTSPDGASWEREEVPASEQFEDLERVVAVGDRLVAVGIRGQRFGTWTRTDGYWRAGSSFGRVDSDGRAAPFVATLVGDGDQHLWATLSDSSRYRLWTSRDGGTWRPVATPSRPTTAGEHVLAVAADARDLVLLADDGKSGRVWIARTHM